MKKSIWLISAGFLLTAIFVIGCSENKPAEPAAEVKESAPEPLKYGGYYDSQVEWGNHLVMVSGCGDCHTPKKMTPQGPAQDSSLLLSGHSDKMPVAQVDRKQIETKGYVVSSDFTSWVGPWGISYTANLTPDETGTGKWTEEQFIYAIRNYVLHGLPGARPLLPPMAMMPAKHFSDDELKAIFAYTRTIKPIRNIVPAATPPVLAKK